MLHELFINDCTNGTLIMNPFTFIIIKLHYNVIMLHYANVSVYIWKHAQYMYECVYVGIYVCVNIYQWEGKYIFMQEDMH